MQCEIILITYIIVIWYCWRPCEVLTIWSHLHANSQSKIAVIRVIRPFILKILIQVLLSLHLEFCNICKSGIFHVNASFCVTEIFIYRPKPVYFGPSDLACFAVHHRLRLYLKINSKTTRNRVRRWHETPYPCGALLPWPDPWRSKVIADSVTSCWGEHFWQ